MSSILIKEYPTALVLYRCEKDATSVGGVSFRKQVISERGTNDIIIADFDKDGYMDMATVGFGGMSGIGGDPYVLLWLYRPNGFSSGSGGESSSDDCAFSSGGEQVLVGSIGMILMVAVVYLSWRVCVLQREKQEHQNFVVRESSSSLSCKLLDDTAY